MTPHAATAELLAAHQLRERTGPKTWILASCCEDWKMTGYDIEAAAEPVSTLHAQHQADMLVAAGVLPTVQEWGVRYLASGRTETVTGAEVARGIAAGGEATVISRWTRATEWTAEEETK